MTGGRSAHEEAEPELYAASAQGRLAEYLEKSPIEGNSALYSLISGLVYANLTRPAERDRGHRACAGSVDRLAPECHDRHQDDVEAVFADVLRHAGERIENLPGWMVARLKPVTIDANRARRGSRGALHKPRRLPKWLCAALGDDPSLIELAGEILTWVGVPIAAPNGIWPLGAWSERRSSTTGDHTWTEARMAAEVERVLAAMRTRPDWHERYVERPLGHKQPPLTSAPRAGDGPGYEPAPLPPVERHEIAETQLRGLAFDMIEAITTRLRHGADLHTAVVEVINLGFSGGTGADEMDCAPGGGSGIEEKAAHELADPATVDRIVAAFLTIAEEH